MTRKRTRPASAACSAAARACCAPSPDESEAFHAEPVLVAGITDAIEVAVEGTTSCALRSTGGVLCWGDGFHRAPLADGDAEHVPLPVPGLSDVVQLEPGCARERSGRVMCFGLDAYARLGEHPVDGVGVIDGLPTDLVDIEVDDHAALALDSEGGLWGWGMFLPHLAHDGPESFGSRARPALVATLPGAREIISGRVRGAFVCVLREDGALLCSGENGTAQLGRGHAEVGPLRHASVPPFEVASALPLLRDVATSGARSCGITRDDERLVCWGGDADAFLLGGGAVRDASAAVSVVDRAIELGVGIGYACALREDRRVYCWGRGADGRLGTGDARSRATPARVGGLEGVDAISIGAVTACALASGRVWCWGDRLAGSGRAPALAPELIDLPGTATAIAVGIDHACAVVGDRAVCWGDGSRGQLGDDTYPLRAAPRVVDALGEVSAVAAPRGATCAVSDGAVLCVGDRADGAVGEGRAALTITTELVRERGIEHLYVALDPIRVLGTEGAIELRAFVGDGVCAWLEGGESTCWGRGYELPRTYTGSSLVLLGGSLCSAADHACVDADGDASTVALPSGELDAIAPGGDVDCALRAGGEVVCWGRGPLGELGDGLAYAVAPVGVDLAAR